MDCSAFSVVQRSSSATGTSTFRPRRTRRSSGRTCSVKYVSPQPSEAAASGGVSAILGIGASYRVLIAHRPRSPGGRVDRREGYGGHSGALAHRKPSRQRRTQSGIRGPAPDAQWAAAQDAHEGVPVRPESQRIPSRCHRLALSNGVCQPISYPARPSVQGGGDNRIFRDQAELALQGLDGAPGLFRVARGRELVAQGCEFAQVGFSLYLPVKCLLWGCRKSGERR